MDNFNPNKKPDGGQPKPALENNQRTHSNSASHQRQRLLDALRKGMVSTIDARRDLDIMHPAARIGELRHRYGHEINTVIVNRQTDCGAWHSVGMYVLCPAAEA
jgi:hypothetical protein